MSNIVLNLFEQINTLNIQNKTITSHAHITDGQSEEG